MTMALGHEVSVTALQMACAYGTIANGGYLMKPQLVKMVLDERGRMVEERIPMRVRSVLRPETARLLTRLLTGVVDHGTGVKARMDRITVAGKTGTAQKVDGDGYSKTKFVASFVGFLPAERADRLLIISVYDPRGGHFGSQVAAPVFKRVIQRLEPADAMRQPRAPSSVQFADLSLDLKGTFRLAETRAANNRRNDSRLLDMSPANLSVVKQGGQTIDTVPDMKGLSLRQAVSLLSACSVKVKIEGTGWVVRQSLRPGSPIKENSICILTAKP